VLADAGIHFLPANLENPLVLAGAVGLASWSLMLFLTDRRPRSSGLIYTAVACILIGVVATVSPVGVAVLVCVTTVAILLAGAITRSTAVRGLWDRSMLRTEPRAAWYASLWVWWSVFVGCLGLLYAYFW
jgi:hypothetical protein